MHVTYDPAVDAGYAKLLESPAVRTERAMDRLLLDFDAQGRLVGCELLDASTPLEIGLLRAAPDTREALRRIHEAAREGTERITSQFLARIRATHGTLAQRRRQVAAHLSPSDEQALLNELRRQRLLVTADE